MLPSRTIQTILHLISAEFTYRANYFLMLQIEKYSSEKEKTSKIYGHTGCILENETVDTAEYKDHMFKYYDQRMDWRLRVATGDRFEV